MGPETVEAIAREYLALHVSGHVVRPVEGPGGFAPFVRCGECSRRLDPETHAGHNPYCYSGRFQEALRG